MDQTVIKAVFIAPPFDAEEIGVWAAALDSLEPSVQVVYGNVPDTSDIDVAIVYYPPLDSLTQFSNLQLIFSLSAGVEALLADPKLPQVPLVRLMNPDIQSLMREYVAYQVLRITRQFYVLENSGRIGRWTWTEPQSPAPNWRVLVMGLGYLGAAAAATLRDLGFRVTGWSRQLQSVPGIRCIAGKPALETALPDSDVVVCLLPLTDETRGLLNSAFFARLPRGASIVNAGRGGCIVEQDLLDALSAGHLSHATLDVFETEPLPAGHPFWTHPAINITPHAAAHPRPDACVAQIAECIELCRIGAPLRSVVERSRGY